MFCRHPMWDNTKNMIIKWEEGCQEREDERTENGDERTEKITHTHIHTNTYIKYNTNRKENKKPWSL